MAVNIHIVKLLIFQFVEHERRAAVMKRIEDFQNETNTTLFLVRFSMDQKKGDKIISQLNNELNGTTHFFVVKKHNFE